MNTRSSTSTVEFAHPFVLPGSRDEFPPGRYEVQVEEELIEGLSFPAFRETAAYLVIYGKRPGSGPKEMRSVSSAALKEALKRDADLTAGVEDAASAASTGKGGLKEDTSSHPERAAEIPQRSEARTVRQRLKQWIETLTSPLPH